MGDESKFNPQASAEEVVRNLLGGDSEFLAKRKEVTDAQKRMLTVQEEADIVREKEKELVIQRVREVIDIYGITPRDLWRKSALERLAGLRRDKRRPKNRQRHGTLYINPENPYESWNGLGRRPKWLMKKLEDGAKLEDFAAEGTGVTDETDDRKAD